jgi:hypothetical protein
MPFPRRAHAALCRGLGKSLSERHYRGVEWVRHGRGMTCVNQTRSHCVNQMGKTQFKTLLAKHARESGMGAASERHGICELTLKRSIHPQLN